MTSPIRLLLLLAQALLLTHFDATAGNYADVHVSQLSPKAEALIWQRAVLVPPRYPLEFAVNGIVGCAVFNVSINAQGQTEQVTVVQSMPTKVNFQPAFKVIKKWQWQNNSNQANRSEQQQIRLDFCMGGDTAAAAQKRCAAQAQLTCAE